MYKQVIVVNKGLNMSAGKLAAMVAHGAEAFMRNWFLNGGIINTISNNSDIIHRWMPKPTKVVLQVENEEEMKTIIAKAKENGMVNEVDYFNIVDESTEFHDIPTWAVIAFRPMDAEQIDKITGNLQLYGYNTANNIMYIDTVTLAEKIAVSVIINDIKNNSWQKINLSLTYDLGEQIIMLARCYNVSTIYIDVLGYGITILDAILSDISIARETNIHKTYYIPKRISRTEYNIKILPVILKPLNKQLRDYLYKR